MEEVIVPAVSTAVPAVETAEVVDNKISTKKSATERLLEAFNQGISYDDLDAELIFKGSPIPLTAFKATNVANGCPIKFRPAKEAGRKNEDGSVYDYAHKVYCSYLDNLYKEQMIQTSSKLWLKDKKGNDVCSKEQLSDYIKNNQLVVVEVLDKQAFSEGRITFTKIVTVENNDNVLLA